MCGHYSPFLCIVVVVGKVGSYDNWKHTEAAAVVAYEAVVCLESQIVVGIWQLWQIVAFSNEANKM